MDAIEGLKLLEDNSIDLVVTDPPYPVISGGKPHKKGQPSGMLSKNDGKIFKHNNIKIEDWLPEVYRVLKEGSHCYVFINTINMEKLLTTARLIGFKLHNILVWEKNNCTPNRWYMKNAEYVLFLRKGKAKKIHNVGSKTVHKFNNIIGNKLHECEKPTDLLEMYIANSSNPNDVILDPFMGSGATAIATINVGEGRRYLGFEIDEDYHKVLTKRIDEYSDEHRGE